MFIAFLTSRPTEVQNKDFVFHKSACAFYLSKRNFMRYTNEYIISVPQLYNAVIIQGVP